MTVAVRREIDAPPAARSPQQLLLALLGEQLDARVDRPIRAGFYLDVLEGAGVAGPTARAALDRMALRGLLTRGRAGREVEYGLTEHARNVLREAAERVHSPFPFDPVGKGWTLVTFTVPEGQRSLRHRLRAALTWEGFAPLRDGLWIAPGEVDLIAALGPLREELPESCVTAFRARDLPDFPVAPSVAGAWDLEAIRAGHERFLAVWDGADAVPASVPPLSALTMLVADWLALLRADPRLPAAFLGPGWPAPRSTAAYRAGRARWSAAARAALP
ncbi:PaaX family transcriptional regulator C-terminal domain-containing protein [Microbacterium sp. SORGH_AS_0888]|uniref:PaaX family transcriptional regulator n=1 Tax=Microbacterium sp. SORGH_AS_0888 TaxID=3041791 RepID=UPI0027D87397|nr:PaaX family transcriptional regulator C-terminal domain-containing protein [Microbacterium sp. SORGH_AS_0888]